MTAKRLCGQLMHDALVYLIEEELQYRGIEPSQIEMFIDYKSFQGDGEIDIYAKLYPNYLLIFEAKCTYSKKNEKKAREQLGRAIENYFIIESRPWLKVFKFLVHYDKDDESGYKIRWLKSFNDTTSD